jgi:transcriptional regulator with XRE-family HTH domain
MEDRIGEELSGLITQVTNEIDWLMRENQVTRADLAARMGVSPGRVSQVLSGGENLTLRTLASLAAALNAHFELELQPAATPAHSYETGQTVPVAAEPTPEIERFEPVDDFADTRSDEYSRRR